MDKLDSLVALESALDELRPWLPHSANVYYPLRQYIDSAAVRRPQRLRVYRFGGERPIIAARNADGYFDGCVDVNVAYDMEAGGDRMDERFADEFIEEAMRCGAMFRAGGNEVIGPVEKGSFLAEGIQRHALKGLLGAHSGTFDLLHGQYSTYCFIPESEHGSLLAEDATLAGFDLSPLEPADMRLVNSKWKYGTAGSLRKMRNAIDAMPSMCARDQSTGELAAWEMSWPSGLMSNMHTLPQYRRMGLARAVETSLAQRLVHRRIMPYKHVISDAPGAIAMTQRSALWHMDTGRKFTWIQYVAKGGAEP